VQAILKEIDDVQQEIEKIGISYFFNDAKSRARKALKARQQNLLFELEHFAEGKGPQVRMRKRR
jgi:hypothetical protein